MKFDTKTYNRSLKRPQAEDNENKMKLSKNVGLVQG